MVPAFMLGLLTAFVYNKTRSLLAPVLVHAIYSAALLGQM
jgi:ABC-2 type transport system permease protein